MRDMTKYMDAVVETVRSWAKARCAVDGESAPSDLYVDYAAWLKGKSYRIGDPSQQAFGKALTALGYTKRKTNGNWLYCAISPR